MWGPIVIIFANIRYKKGKYHCIIGTTHTLRGVNIVFIIDYNCEKIKNTMGNTCIIVRLWTEIHFTPCPPLFNEAF